MYEEIYSIIRELIDNILHDKGDSQYKEDLLQEIMLIILEYDKKVIEELYNNKNNNNALKYFLVRIIKNQYYSTTSPFYKTFKKFSQSSDELITITTENDINEDYD